MPSFAGKASKISYTWTKTAPIIPSVTDNTAAPSYAEAVRSAASNSQGGNFMPLARSTTR